MVLAGLGGIELTCFLFNWTRCPDGENAISASKLFDIKIRMNGWELIATISVDSCYEEYLPIFGRLQNMATFYSEKQPADLY